MAKLILIINKIAHWSFIVGVLAILIYIGLSALSIQAPLWFGYSAVLMAYIPKFAWLFNILKDPYG